MPAAATAAVGLTSTHVAIHSTAAPQKQPRQNASCTAETGAAAKKKPPVPDSVDLALHPVKETAAGHITSSSFAVCAKQQHRPKVDRSAHAAAVAAAPRPGRQSDKLLGTSPAPEPHPPEPRPTSLDLPARLSSSSGGPPTPAQEREEGLPGASGVSVPSPTAAPYSSTQTQHAPKMQRSALSPNAPVFKPFSVAATAKTQESAFRKSEVPIPQPVQWLQAACPSDASTLTPASASASALSISGPTPVTPGSYMANLLRRMAAAETPAASIHDGTPVSPQPLLTAAALSAMVERIRMRAAQEEAQDAEQH
jgi:hypothetical protein